MRKQEESTRALGERTQMLQVAQNRLQERVAKERKPQPLYCAERDKKIAELLRLCELQVRVCSASICI